MMNEICKNIAVMCPLPIFDKYYFKLIKTLAIIINRYDLKSNGHIAVCFVYYLNRFKVK